MKSAGEEEEQSVSQCNANAMLCHVMSQILLCPFSVVWNTLSSARDRAQTLSFFSPCIVMLSLRTPSRPKAPALLDGGESMFLEDVFAKSDWGLAL